MAMRASNIYGRPLDLFATLNCLFNWRLNAGMETELFDWLFGTRMYVLPKVKFYVEMESKFNYTVVWNN